MSARLASIRCTGIVCIRPALLSSPAKPAAPRRSISRAMSASGGTPPWLPAPWVAVTLDLAASLTDQAVDLFDRLIGMMFRKADERHARAFQADGRAINEQVRLYACVGAALIAARDNKQDPFDAITAVIPWDRFLATVAQAEALARSEEFDASQMLAPHYAGIRRWAPAFLDALVFQSVPAAAALMRAIDMLRDMNRKTAPSLPKSAPISFIRERWARHVLR